MSKSQINLDKKNCKLKEPLHQFVIPCHFVSESKGKTENPLFHRHGWKDLVHECSARIGVDTAYSQDPIRKTPSHIERNTFVLSVFSY